MRKDTLAAGAKSCNFGGMSHISKEKWDSIFEPAEKPKSSRSNSKLKPAKSPLMRKKG